MAADDGRTWTISRLARDAGVNVETIRYYERVGLLRQPRKPAEGWRRYDEESLLRIRFIKRGQQLGFSLAEVKVLLGLRGSDSPRTCARVSQRAIEKLAEIDAKIRDLQAMRDVLAGLTETCAGVGTGDACPMLRALEVGSPAVVP